MSKFPDIQNIQVNTEGFSSIVSKKSSADDNIMPINFKSSNTKIDPDNLKTKDLKKILKKYGEDDSRTNRDNISELQFDNENKTLSITYKKGDLKQKIIKEDLSYETIADFSTDDSDGTKEIKKSFSKENVLLKEKITKQNYSCETFYDLSGKKSKTIEVEKKKGSTTTILYDESEKPQKKEVKSGSTIKCFDFGGKNGNERITQKIENSGLPIESREEFSYTDNGNVRIEHHSAQTNMSGNKKTTPFSFGNGIIHTESGNSGRSDATVQYCSMSNFDSSNGTVRDDSLLCSSESGLESFSSSSSISASQISSPQSDGSVMQNYSAQISAGDSGLGATPVSGNDNSIPMQKPDDRRTPTPASGQVPNGGSDQRTIQSQTQLPTSPAGLSSGSSSDGNVMQNYSAQISAGDSGLGTTPVSGNDNSIPMQKPDDRRTPTPASSQVPNGGSDQRTIQSQTQLPTSPAVLSSGSSSDGTVMQNYSAQISVGDSGLGTTPVSGNDNNNISMQKPDDRRTPTPASSQVPNGGSDQRTVQSQTQLPTSPAVLSSGSSSDGTVMQNYSAQISAGDSGLGATPVSGNDNSIPMQKPDDRRTPTPVSGQVPNGGSDQRTIQSQTQLPTSTSTQTPAAPATTEVLPPAVNVTEPLTTSTEQTQPTATSVEQNPATPVQSGQKQAIPVEQSKTSAPTTPVAQTLTQSSETVAEQTSTTTPNSVVPTTKEVPKAKIVKPSTTPVEQPKTPASTATSVEQNPATPVQSGQKQTIPVEQSKTSAPTTPVAQTLTQSSETVVEQTSTTTPNSVVQTTKEVQKAKSVKPSTTPVEQPKTPASTASVEQNTTAPVQSDKKPTIPVEQSKTSAPTTVVEQTPTPAPMTAQQTSTIKANLVEQNPTQSETVAEQIPTTTPSPVVSATTEVSTPKAKIETPSTTPVEQPKTPTSTATSVEQNPATLIQSGQKQTIPVEQPKTSTPTTPVEQTLTQSSETVAEQTSTTIPNSAVPTTKEVPKAKSETPSSTPVEQPKTPTSTATSVEQNPATPIQSGQKQTIPVEQSKTSAPTTPVAQTLTQSSETVVEQTPTTAPKTVEVLQNATQPSATFVELTPTVAPKTAKQTSTRQASHVENTTVQTSATSVEQSSTSATAPKAVVTSQNLSRPDEVSVSITPEQGNIQANSTQNNLSVNQKLSGDINTEINSLGVQFGKSVEQYANGLKLSVNDVKILLGVPSNIDAQSYLQNILNESLNSGQSVNEIINKFKTLFKNNGKNNIENAVAKLKKLIIETKENNKSVINNKNAETINNNDYVDISSLKAVPDIGVFSSRNGIKTTELMSEIKGMKKGDSKIISLSSKSGEKSYRIVINAKGEVLLAEVRRKTEAEKTETEKQALISEYSYAIPSELRQKLANCKSANDIKRFIEDYIEDRIISNKTKETVVNPVSEQQFVSGNAIGYYSENTNPVQSQANGSVNKVSLNSLNPEMKKELSNLLLTGKYKNSNGQIISIGNNSDVANFENPNTDYKEENIDKKAEILQQAIINLAKKYKKSEIEKENDIADNSLSKNKLNSAIVIYEDEEKIKQLNERITNMLAMGIPDVQVVAFIASLVYSSDYKKTAQYIPDKNRDIVTANEEL